MTNKRLTLAETLAQQKTEDPHFTLIIYGTANYGGMVVSFTNIGTIKRYIREQKNNSHEYYSHVRSISTVLPYRPTNKLLYIPSID